MPPSPSFPRPAARHSAHALGWPLALLVFACLAVSGLWTLVSLHSGRLCGGMAVPLALASIAALRLGGMPRRPLRRALAVAATLLCSALVAWCVIALEIGFSLGLGPLAAVQKLGPHLALTMLQLAATPADFIGLLAALLLAIWLGK